MTQAELYAALAATGLPVVYGHWPVKPGPPSPPYITYRFSASDDFIADNHNYAAFKEFDVELYAKLPDAASEALIETVFTTNRIPYEKTELWIESEELYMTLYQITI